MGRAKTEIDRKRVEALAGIGCTVAEMAMVLGCSKEILERRFATSIEKGRAEAKASLRRMQWQAAQKGSTAMLIWLGKQILGQNDKREVTANMNLSQGFDASKLSDEQLEQLEALVESAHAESAAVGAVLFEKTYHGGTETRRNKKS
jgi:hypothetical protein